MSLTTLNHPLPDLLPDALGRLPRLRRPRPQLRAWLAYWVRAAVWWTWMGLHLASVALAGVVDWFAEDPRRVRVAVTGAAVCTAVGAVVGIGLGWVLAQVVALVIDVLWAGQA